MIAVSQALARAFALAPDCGVEWLELGQCAGRVLAHDCHASLDQPPFAASAMDGYAMRRAEVVARAHLRVIGEAAAGHGFAGAVSAGECVRIFTGAPVPKGADTVVIQEDVTRRGDQIILGDQLGRATHIRPRGADFTKGQAFGAPRRLGAAQLALLAAMNVARLQVYKRPVVAIIATGDELVELGTTPGAGQIISSNSIALAEIVRSEGALARVLPIARDNVASLKLAFDLARDADLIVTSGGASVGDHDLVAPVAKDLGLEMDFYKVAMRPGKPLMAGRFEHAMLLGLPGNPVSSLVCAHVFLRPILRKMLGLGARELACHRAKLGAALPANGARQHYMRATFGADGTVIAARSQDSAMLGVMSEATALIVRPPHDPARRIGDEIGILAL